MGKDRREKQSQGTEARETQPWVGGADREKQQDEQQRTCGLGRERGVYHRKQLSAFSWSLGRLLIGQLMLRKVTRSQRDFIKIINGVQAEARMKEKDLCRLG